jgi:macrolide glycosyltransferase
MLQALGVARRGPMEEAMADTLREAVLAMAGDPEVARRLKEIQEKMTAEGGAERAADLIEEELRVAEREL